MLLPRHFLYLLRPAISLEQPMATTASRHHCLHRYLEDSSSTLSKREEKRRQKRKKNNSLVSLIPIPTRGNWLELSVRFMMYSGQKGSTPPPVLLRRECLRAVSAAAIPTEATESQTNPKGNASEGQASFAFQQQRRCAGAHYTPREILVPSGPLDY